jgi:hypothetical protein
MFLCHIKHIPKRPSPRVMLIRVTERRSTSAIPTPSPPQQGTRTSDLARSSVVSPSTVISPSRLAAPSPRRPLVSSSSVSAALASSSTIASVPHRLESIASTNSLVTRSKYAKGLRLAFSRQSARATYPEPRTVHAQGRRGGNDGCCACYCPAGIWIWA